MVDGFGFPFRFVNQKAVRLDTSSEAYKAQLLASAVNTQVGELPLTPDFGSRIAPFSGLDMGDFLATVSTYIQSVGIKNITQKINSDQSVSLSIQFVINEDQ